MNTQLINSLVQVIHALPVEERAALTDRLFSDDLADTKDDLSSSMATELTPAVSEQKRVFGQYRGRISMSEDFDKPLADSFWLGEK